MTAIAPYVFGVMTLALASGAYAHDPDHRHDDENIISQNLDHKGFDRIVVSGVYDLDVRVGDKFSVVVSGPDYEMNRIETSVENGVLHLGQREMTRAERRQQDGHNHGYNIVISMPRLAGLDVSGVGDGKINNIDADEFEIDISGVGNITLGGKCNALDAHVSGVGDLNAENFNCKKVDISVSGVGDAVVHASEEVDARVSGMGDIDVFGSPKRVRKNDGMFADITIR